MLSRRALMFVAPVSLLAVPLLAQQMPSEAPGKLDPSRVAPGTYRLDPNHTLIGWRVDHLGFSDYFGVFGDATGTLMLDPDDPWPQGYRLTDTWPAMR